ncbi:hypothetical protein V1502_16990 [Bacillus sp. SCS-153A]|uniref:hypothetical protein n=1 Tax=Rossellomorea sedimentorum TaxID=3115294 RepID=UPI003906ABC1
MWGIGKPKREIQGEITEHIAQEFDGKVLVSIKVDAIDRQNRKVKIVITEKQSEEVVFKAEYQSSQKEYLAYESARELVKAFVRENGYYLDNEVTNVQKASISTVKRFR